MIYLKTGNYSFDALPGDEFGYKVVNRKNLLDILNECRSDNNILTDYREGLQNKENETNAYFNTDVSGWNDLAWEGFYTYLESITKDDGKYMWNYVPCRQGSFIAGFGDYQYLWKRDDNRHMYIQFNQKNDVNKGDVTIRMNNLIGIDSNDIWAVIEETAKDIGLADFVERPIPLRNSGGTRTVAKIPHNKFFKTKIITAEMVDEQLKKCRKLITESAKRIEAKYL